MSDIKLFRTKGTDVNELKGSSVQLEKSLQALIERNLETFLGIRFLSTEHSTGKTHGGRIDTLGMDENGCPVIIEYKRSSNENVINQGLFYLDWLLDHKAEFELLVTKQLGAEVAESIEWSSPRLVCIAGGFTKYDSHAVQQINRNIELIRYVKFDEDLLLFEMVNAVQASSGITEGAGSTDAATESTGRQRLTVDDQLSLASTELIDLYEEVKRTCLGFGDDIQVKHLKKYIAFKRIKNFLSVCIRRGVDGNRNEVMCYAKVDPDTIELEEGFTRDVKGLGHWGTGDLEISIHTSADLDKALPLLQQSYDAS